MRPLDPRLLYHARAARSHLLVITVLGAFAAGLVIAQASVLAHLLAGAVTDAAHLGPVRPALLSLVGIIAARAALSYTGEVVSARAATAVKSELRLRLLGRTVALGPEWLGGQRAGELAALATRGLDALDGYFSRYLPQLILAVLVPVAVLGRLLAADWASGLIVALTLPLIPMFMVLVGLHTRAQTDRQWGTLARLAGHFSDVVAGLPTLRIFGRATAQAATIRRVTEAHREATMRTLRVAFLSALVLELVASLSVALVAVSIGLRLVSGQLGLKTALLILLLAPEAYLPLRAVGAQFHASSEGLGAAQQVMAVLEQQVAAPAAARPPALGPRVGTTLLVPDLRRCEIVLRAVTVCRAGRAAPALDGVSLRLAPGERIAIVGPSGSGKSTLLGVLLRLVDPDAGRVTVGGGELTDLDPTVWRSQIAWVAQRPHLFAGSIADNIRLGDPNAPPSEVRKAARAAAAEEFITSLPRGYDTRLGEDGAGLSGGQRQRVALARAFLRDAPLLLLDEPTAGLDPASATAVRTALGRLMVGRTVLLVTHRRTMLSAVDRTLVLTDGRLQTENQSNGNPPKVPARALR